MDARKREERDMNDDVTTTFVGLTMMLAGVILLVVILATL